MDQSIFAPQLAFVEPVVTVNINDALALRSNRHTELPIVDSTGEYTADKRFDELFQVLLSLDTVQERLNHVENLLFTTNHFPNAAEINDPFPTFLRRIWLEIFNEEYGPSYQVKRE